MANLEYARYVAARGGAHLIEQDLTQTYATPRVNSETKVLDYVVPSNKKFTAESLIVNFYHQQIPADTNSASLIAAVAIVRIKTASTTGFEAMLFSQGLPRNLNGGDEIVTPAIQSSQGFSFGDGITIPSGTLFEITFQTTSGFQSTVGKARAIGATAGVTDIRTGTALLATTGETSIVSFTPSSNYTLYSVAFDADKHDMQWGGLAVELDGRVVFELPMTVNFNTQTIAGPLIYPLFGLEFYPTQRISVAADPIAPHGGVMSATLNGKLEDLGGGGGSTAFSFAFIG